MPTLANKRKEYLDETYDEDLNPLGPVEEQEEYTGPPSGESQKNMFPTEHPLVTNEDGTDSNVKTMTVEMDGKHYVIPSMVGGKQLTADEAVVVARGQGLDKYPSFSTGPEALKFSEEEHANQPPPEEEKDRGLVAPREVMLSTDSWTENPLDLLQYIARAPRTFRKTVESLPLTLKKGRPKALRQLAHGLKGVARGGVFAVVGDWLATNFAVPALASAVTGDEWAPKDVDAATDLAFTEAWRAFQDFGGVHPDKKMGKGHFKALWEQALAGGDVQAYGDSIDPIAREIRLLQKAANAADGENIRKYMEDNPPARLKAARERRLTGKKEN